MEIRFQAHHATIDDSLRARAERALRKLAERVPRATAAVVRFNEDGPARRVEVELHARDRTMVVSSRARAFPAALSDAVHRLRARIGHERQHRNRKHAMRARRVASTA